MVKYWGEVCPYGRWTLFFAWRNCCEAQVVFLTTNVEDPCMKSCLLMRRGKMDSLNLFVKLARVVLREINVYEAFITLHVLFQFPVVVKLGLDVEQVPFELFELFLESLNQVLQRTLHFPLHGDIHRQLFLAVTTFLLSEDSFSCPLHTRNLGLTIIARLNLEVL